MSKPRVKKAPAKPIKQYDHKGKERVNNPPVGLVTSETDKDEGKKKYAYDPHLDPHLQWAGKTEHTSFAVPTVSLHVHERIDPRTIIEAVRKQEKTKLKQKSLFEWFEENPPLKEAIQFYKHRHNWSNRLIAGDSLLVMNSLLEKEGMAQKVQMVYIDPPYGIRYRSNFQPFVNKRDVKEGKDEDLTTEPEQIQAFRDTWELGIHSYLTYLRDRLLLAKELLHDSGSIFVQISDENVHYVRALMDEIFGSEHFVCIISFKKTSAQTSKMLPVVEDFIVWYAKNKENTKFRRLYQDRHEATEFGTFRWIELPDGTCQRLSMAQLRGEEPIPQGKRFRASNLTSQSGGDSTRFPIQFEGKSYLPSTTRGWSTNEAGIQNLIKANRIIALPKVLCFKYYENDFPYTPMGNQWEDTILGTFTTKLYVVQTAEIVIQRCMLMTTDPGDLVLDPTCGSGTTAIVAERWGRRWITCDTSRVAITIAKQRIMTSLFPYFTLLHPEEGVGSGFKYNEIPHITLKSIARKETPTTEILYDQPIIDNTKIRVNGPFTVEAVPAPVVKPLSEVETEKPAEVAVARMGETSRQSDWRDELLKTGIRGKDGQKMEFSRLEVLPGTRWLHADGETIGDPIQRAIISFGPEHAPLGRRQVEMAIKEAQKLVPKPTIVIFAAFQFDPEASKDIDERNWPNVTLLKAQMNADLLTDDLKKNRASNESFWLIGQPDVKITKTVKGQYQVELCGFDYYNTITGNIESGGTKKVTMWSLDTDYDGRSIFPRQVFFPMAGKSEGWASLAKNLKTEIDDELIEYYSGFESLPFNAGDYKQIAVKVVDDRGIESLRIMELE